MTWRKREIMEMAQTLSHGWWLDDDKLEAFAKLVREDERKNERERVLKLFDTELGFCNDPMGQEALDRMKEAIQARGQA